MQRAVPLLIALFRAPSIRRGWTLARPPGGRFARFGRDTLPGICASLLVVVLQNTLDIDRLKVRIAALEESEQDLTALNIRLRRVQEDERRCLALDLHDDPLQRASRLARELSDVPADPTISRWRAEVEELVTSLRALCVGLHPPLLDDLGLAAALERLINDMRACADWTVALSIERDGGMPFGRLETALEVALFRIAQEALSNCLKHADATVVRVRLVRDGFRIALAVSDDGRGLPTGVDTRHPSAVRLGLLGMRERLRPWNGVVTVERGAAGGTVVTAALYLPSTDAGEGDAHGTC